MQIQKNISVMTVFSKTKQIFTICVYKIKVHKTSKCLWSVYVGMFIVK